MTKVEWGITGEVMEYSINAARKKCCSEEVYIYLPYMQKYIQNRGSLLNKAGKALKLLKENMRKEHEVFLVCEAKDFRFSPIGWEDTRVFPA